MTTPNFKCDFDEDRNAVLYEIDSARVRRKVATKLKDGRIVFEPSYDKLSESQKEGYRIAINTCPLE
jgi:hypothetical protein